MDKKATSLIISYVLLITIAIGLSIGIYSWIKSNADISPDIDCKEDTSLIVMGYEIEESPDKLVLSLKNNGYFNIDGFILSVGENELEVPIILLDADDGFEGTAGTYYFPGNPLEPGETISAGFFPKNAQTEDPVDLGALKIIQFQPFIIQKGSKVLCKEGVVKLKLADIPSEVTPHHLKNVGMTTLILVRNVMVGLIVFLLANQVNVLVRQDFLQMVLVVVSLIFLMLLLQAHMMDNTYLLEQTLIF